ncbi:SusC/RagA family TonB-linked outer membrane protein [Flectobacillus major]|uniref:SusC/RagA family TonB-linked outer membrane protein n=1 Tax=Flectobacillus major TaxID=103 RepID=UPI0004043FF2|nr:TonB-dependent receptor [Flectobacillus major]
MKNKLLNYFKHVFVLTALLVYSVSSMAQDRRVTGKVAGVDNQGIPGVSILIKGTRTGTTTDASGSFSINSKSANDVLVLTGIGYKSKEVTIGGQSVVNIVLEEDVAALDEVIVTGYSSSNKKESTAAISTVKAKDLTAVPSGNIEQQLQGKVSGVTVITSGQPGTTSIVRVRGFGSFGGNNPLYVVDGVPTQSTDFLAPDDIESTTVLKDAAAASIYGARAASGVIVYTTKKGTKKARPLEITYDGMYGVTDPGTGIKMLNPQDQATWTWKALGPGAKHDQYGSGTTPIIPDYLLIGSPSGGRKGYVGSIDIEAERAKYQNNPLAGPLYLVMAANKQGTDWYKAITRTAPLTRHNLGFSGGTETSRFYFGLGVQEQSGILKFNEFRRYDFRANSEFDITKKLRIGENLQFTYRQTRGLAGGNGGAGIAQEESYLLDAQRMPTIIPIYDVFGGYAGSAAGGFSNARNPVQGLTLNSNDNVFGLSGFGNIYAEYDVLPELTLRTSFGGGVNFNTYRDYTFVDHGNSEPVAGKNALREGSSYNYNWVWTNQVNYKKKIGLHGIEALAGIEALNTGAGRNIEGFGQDPFTTSLDYLSLSTISSGRNVTGGLFSGVNFYSIFGQANYSYNSRYFLTAVVRRDGSSRFGANNRYGVFPAFSAAWRLSSEDFMKDLSFINDLKVRAGWGQMGNSNNVDPNNQYSLYSSSIGTAAYDITGTNNAVAEGFYRSRIGNPNAKWETAETSNIGLDASILNGKFEVQLDFWRKDTKDLLFQVPIAGVIGTLASAPSVNIANMRNQGIDLQIVNHGKINSDLKYDITVNGSLLSNTITSLAPGTTYFDVSPPTNRLSAAPTRNKEGESMASFFGYKVIGYFKDDAEVKSAPAQEGAGPGRFRFADVNGDGKIDADDRTILGSPIPKFTGGINLKVTYKNFDIETYLYTSLGNQIFNMTKWYTNFYSTFPGSAKAETVKNSWTPTNLNASSPIFENVSNFSTDTQPNSWYVENGSYLRMTNLALGYNLPKDLLKKMKIRTARIALSTNNVFTVTSYSGLDPQVGGQADTNFGIDIGNYPVTRSYNLSVKLGF